MDINDKIIIGLNNLFIIPGIILTLILFSSCMSQSKIEYLQTDISGQNEYNNLSFKDYTLKSNDELYIQISSLDEATANFFSNTTNQLYSSSVTPFGASLMSHTVNEDGNLELPVIGSLQVRDRTLTQVCLLIKDSLRNILNQPVVTVKLVNRYVSVLGEVRNPGHYVYSQDKLTIFDALGLAGDIADYGNRKEVVLIRNENDKNIRININLLHSSVLASEQYFLKPGDIIYVKPLKNKFWGLRQFPFAIVISSISTLILVLNYIDNN